MCTSVLDTGLDQCMEEFNNKLAVYSHNPVLI